MQTLNYWKQFEHTGKIQDYLSYKSCAQDACRSGENRPEGQNTGDEAQRAGSEAVCRDSYM
ncbi:MAG: hypothetical protein NC081_08065 [Roseburia sp.]|nr:hypothetical protein [Roseburia sp.]